MCKRQVGEHAVILGEVDVVDLQYGGDITNIHTRENREGGTSIHTLQYTLRDVRQDKTDACVMRTPLGSPVVPLVYLIWGAIDE